MDVGFTETLWHSMYSYMKCKPFLYSEICVLYEIITPTWLDLSDIWSLWAKHVDTQDRPKTQLPVMKHSSSYSAFLIFLTQFDFNGRIELQSNIRRCTYFNIHCKLHSSTQHESYGRSLCWGFPSSRKKVGDSTTMLPDKLMILT
jgi:hypothetical protein